MFFRTDMAVERRDMYKAANRIEKEIDGIECEEEKINDILITRVKITNENGEEALQRKKGEYITIDIKKLNNITMEKEQEIINAFSKELLRIIDNHIEKNEEILEDIYSTIHNSLEISSPDKFFGMHYKNKNDLIINVMMCDVIMEKIKFDEVLNHYIEIVINSTENIEEVLRCVEILNNYLKIKSMPIIEKQYILFNICYNVDDIDIRNMTVIMSNIFMDVDIYREKILRTLENRVKNITFEELNGYFNLITKFDDKSIFNNIIKVLKNNRNYYIKYFSNEHL